MMMIGFLALIVIAFMVGYKTESAPRSESESSSAYGERSTSQGGIRFGSSEPAKSGNISGINRGNSGCAVQGARCR